MRNATRWHRAIVDILILLGDQYWAEGDLGPMCRQSLPRRIECRCRQCKSDAWPGAGTPGHGRHQGGCSTGIDRCSTYRIRNAQPEFKFQANYSLADMRAKMSVSSALSRYAESRAKTMKLTPRMLDFALACVCVNLGRHEAGVAPYLVEANRQARETGSATAEQSSQAPCAFARVCKPEWSCQPAPPPTHNADPS